MKKDYEAILAVAPEFGKYPLEEFMWARMSASSRIFGVVIGETKTDVFVPYAGMLNHPKFYNKFLDMLNHKRPKQTS